MQRPRSALGYDLGPGGRLGDRWVIDGMLGTGGMGSVVRCHDENDPSQVRALKVLELTSPAARARFEREGRLLGRVDHPGVVRVHGVRLDADPPYIEMDLVEGTTLEEVLDAGRSLGLARALEIAGTLAEVVTHLHANAIYHRDLKPANVIIGRNGSATLVDFGVAKLEDGKAMTAPGTRMGTVAYAPPEWAAGRDLRPPLWDVYSLGVILYELLEGDYAYGLPGDQGPMLEAMRLMRIKADQPYLEPSEAFPEVVRELVRSLTANAPHERPQTAREALHRVRTVQRDPEVVAWIRGQSDAATIPAETRPAPTPSENAGCLPRFLRRFSPRRPPSSTGGRTPRR